MDSVDSIRRLHEHRIWANHRLLESCRAVAEFDLKRAFEIGQGSIWTTLTHLVAAEFVWLEALKGNESPVLPGDVADQLPGNQQGERPFVSLDDLGRFWHKLDGGWVTFLSELTKSDIDRPITKISTSSGLGKRHSTRCVDVLLHVCTHAQYTSAQLVNMLKQVGVSSLPDIMLITMARSEVADGKW